MTGQIFPGTTIDTHAGKVQDGLCLIDGTHVREAAMTPESTKSGPLARRGWPVVRIALGVLLLTAAVLKLAGRNVSAVPQVGWYATPMAQIAAAEWELVLAIWLLSGAYRIGAWLAALATFVTFAGISGYLGWIGVASCGCFGAIHASPWHAFAVDLVPLFLLGVFRPGVSQLSKLTVVSHQYCTFSGQFVSLSRS